MANNTSHSPASYKGVMVSSTFTDLKEHRAELLKAIKGQELMPVGMENDSAKPEIDVIDSSLQMVQKASAYIGVISHRYGQIHEDPSRNPQRLSLTELEFDEAQRLKRPILLFIMGEEHPVKPRDVERDPEKFEKLKAFRKNSKRLSPDSSVHRIYKVFNSLDEFTNAAIQAIAELRRYLDEQTEPFTESIAEPEPTPANPDGIPIPPAFYAEPAYIGTHEFVGRRAQLETLNDWATPDDPHPILLFEAIGGTGKSMLTWEWVKKHANNVRNDWAGIFWYSFYERGAIMADFCRRALAYMTGQPLNELRKKKTLELSDLLLRQLNAKPWLLILDGLERVLVAYHRFDAAQMADEEAGTTDKIAQRDPCDAIRPEDDDLLRMLAAADPSKLLLTTRLTPKILLNRSSQAIPGVLRERLPGLRPDDAEELLRACGITGTSEIMRGYLQRHCDCHPLVTGVVAGLVNDYFPNRGNFDAWAEDPDHGGHLNLAELDLVRKRNHILLTALDALPEKSRQLLSTLALLSESVDYELLSALNPHLPVKLKEVNEPDNPREFRYWNTASEEEKDLALKWYEDQLKQRHNYNQAQKKWQKKVTIAQRKLANTVRNLEQRGLLQYDSTTKRYDLHPVVRGTTTGSLREEERESFGKPLVDHFSQQSLCRNEEVETLEEVHNELILIRILLKMERYQQASEAYNDELNRVLLFNLDAVNEILTLLHPFFLDNWSTIRPNCYLNSYKKGEILNSVGNALKKIGKKDEALKALASKILIHLWHKDWNNLTVGLHNIANVFEDKNCLAKALKIRLFDMDITLLDKKHKKNIFRARLGYFSTLSLFGQWTKAETIWQILSPMGRDWPRHLYRSGNAEREYAKFLFWQGKLHEEELAHAEQLSKKGKDREIIRDLFRLRGQWHLEQKQWEAATNSFRQAVRMIREVGQKDEEAETFLALAQYRLNQLPDPHHTAEQLSNTKEPAHRPLAELWFAIGNHEQATKHALAAYKWAWADGEPYVSRYELNKARALLERLGADIPDLPP